MRVIVIVIFYAIILPALALLLALGGAARAAGWKTNPIARWSNWADLYDEADRSGDD